MFSLKLILSLMSCVLSCHQSSVVNDIQPERIICICRYIFQLHHDDGGQQCGPDCCSPQLPPPDSRDSRHASLGWSTELWPDSQRCNAVFTGPQCLPAVAALATEDEQTKEKNISQNNNDEQ